MVTDRVRWFVTKLTIREVSKMNTNPKRRKMQSLNVIDSFELQKKVDEIMANLKSQTWKDLETHGKFKKNDKLSFITDDMLIVGCDIGSETHYIRAVDSRGRELSRKAFSFSNDIDGFQAAKEWAVQLAAENDKKQIVLGLEPTGHYWFCLASWMISEGISVVQVNPYAVKQTKEVEDNSQQKDDEKDPKTIANLVVRGNFGMPYLPEGIYADLRGYSALRDKLVEDRTRCVNRLHRELKIFFPEYKDAFGKIDGVFTLELIKVASTPRSLIKLGEDGIKNIWHNAKLRGGCYSKAATIIEFAEKSVGLTEGIDAGADTISIYADELCRLDKTLGEIEEKLHAKCMEIPYAENILEINGIGENTLSGIIAEMGDISRFDDVKEIQKLSGLGLVACSSGKHKGETKISHRGRKRLRFFLFQAAKSAVAHATEYKQIHMYYTTRVDNPLKKMQSLIVIACKILRVVYTMLKTGTRYDPKKLMDDIRLPENARIKAA